MIYVVGSLNIDYVARVDKAPVGGETVVANNAEINFGGKGANQAVAVAKMGGKVMMIGCVGSDQMGGAIKDKLAFYGVCTDFVAVKDGLSGSAYITIDGSGENRIVVCQNANALLTERDVEIALKDAKADDILLVSLEIPLDTAAAALKMGKEKGMFTVLNPAPARELSGAILASSDILIPNETETEVISEVNPIDIVHSVLAIKKLYTLGANDVVITLGGRGSLVAQGLNVTEVDIAQKIKPIDTTGCGDTYVGALCCMLSRGASLVEGCRFASCAASLTASKKGAMNSVPTLGEVAALRKITYND